MTTQRARSRLQPKATKPDSHRKPIGRAAIKSLPSLGRHWRFLPLLIIAVAFYAGLYRLMRSVYPGQISDWLLPKSFIPFHLLLFFGNFFFFTFLTLSKRWGVFIALALEWLVFLKLQSVVLDVWALSSAVVIGTSGWWLRTLWKNRAANL